MNRMGSRLARLEAAGSAAAWKPPQIVRVIFEPPGRDTAGVTLGLPREAGRYLRTAHGYEPEVA